MAHLAKGEHAAPRWLIVAARARDRGRGRVLRADEDPHGARAAVRRRELQRHDVQRAPDVGQTVVDGGGEPQAGVLVVEGGIQSCRHCICAPSVPRRITAAERLAPARHLDGGVVQQQAGEQQVPCLGDVVGEAIRAVGRGQVVVHEPHAGHVDERESSPRSRLQLAEHVLGLPLGRGVGQHERCKGAIVPGVICHG